MLFDCTDLDIVKNIPQTGNCSDIAEIFVQTFKGCKSIGNNWKNTLQIE